MPATTLPAPTKPAKATKQAPPAAATPAPPSTALLAPPPTPDELSKGPNKFQVGGPGLSDVLSLLSADPSADETNLEQKLAERAGKKPEPKPETTVGEVVKEKPLKIEAPVETKVITAESTDAELDKHIETSTKNMSPAQAAAFKPLVYENRDFKRKQASVIPELEAKIKALESRAPVKDEEAVAALQKKLSEFEKERERYETELGGTNVKKTKMWMDEVEKPMAALREEFKAFAEEREVDAAMLIELANLRGTAKDAKFEEVTEGWNNLVQQDLGDLLKRHTKLTRHQATIEAGGKQRYDDYVRQQSEAESLKRAAIATERAEALPKVWSEAIESAAPFLKEKEGDEAWNAELAQVRDFVKQADNTWLNNQSQYEQARLSAQAAVLPMTIKHYEGEIQVKDAEIERLNAYVQELKGSSATVGAGGDAPREPQSQEDKDKNLTFSERVARGINTGEWKP